MAVYSLGSMKSKTNQVGTDILCRTRGHLIRTFQSYIIHYNLTWAIRWDFAAIYGTSWSNAWSLRWSLHISFHSVFVPSGWRSVLQCIINPHQVNGCQRRLKASFVQRTSSACSFACRQSFRDHWRLCRVLTASWKQYSYVQLYRSLGYNQIGYRTRTPLISCWHRPGHAHISPFSPLWHRYIPRLISAAPVPPVKYFYRTTFFHCHAFWQVCFKCSRLDPFCQYHPTNML